MYVDCNLARLEKNEMSIYSFSFFDGRKMSLSHWSFLTQRSQQCAAANDAMTTITMNPRLLKSFFSPRPLLRDSLEFQHGYPKTAFTLSFDEDRLRFYSLFARRAPMFIGTNNDTIESLFVD